MLAFLQQDSGWAASTTLGISLVAIQLILLPWQFFVICHHTEAFLPFFVEAGEGENKMGYICSDLMSDSKIILQEVLKIISVNALEMEM